MNTLEQARQASDAAAQRRAEAVLRLLRRVSSQVFSRAAGADAVDRLRVPRPA